jgi:hypothetical protein
MLLSIIIVEFSDAKELIKTGIDSGMRNALYESLRLLARGVSTKLRSTTDTWNGAKPDFPRSGGIHIKTTGDDVFIEIVPTGDQEGINKWVWLDEGTDVRLAFMSKDWVSKTEPGRFRSGSGTGEVLFIRKQSTDFIEARGWSVMASNEIRRQMGHIIDNTIDKALSKAGW